MAKKSLADCSIYAPANGIIGKGVMNVGEVVLPALPVAKILVINSVKVRASIPEKEIAAIKVSMPSRITLEAIPNQLFEGEGIEKCIESNNITHTYDIKISVKNPNKQLLPGMVANVEINNNIDNPINNSPIKNITRTIANPPHRGAVTHNQDHVATTVLPVSFKTRNIRKSTSKNVRPPPTAPLVLLISTIN